MDNRSNIVTVIVVGVVAMWAWGLLSHVSHEHHPAVPTNTTVVDAGAGADLRGE